MNRQDPANLAVEPECNSWRPVLAGEVRARALAAIHEIAAVLSATWRELIDPSLANGTSGLAILYTYLDQAVPEKGNDEVALRFLNHAVTAIETKRMGPSLYGGISGVAFAIAHIEGGSPNAAEENSYEAIDHLLGKYLDQSPWGGKYDLIGGVVGLGVYALERLPHPRAVEIIERVIGHLAEIAERRGDGGITWFTVPELLVPWQRELCPQGYYNLGVAHGVPGVIALLGEACAAGVARDKARPLLDGAVAWLLSQKLTNDAKSSFPSWAAPGIKQDSSRLAWCYGDLGLAAALLCAARCVGQSIWEGEALEIARQAAERPADQSGVIDGGLCHGAAGVGHLFNRMFQASGNARLREAAAFWFDRALEMRRPGQGVAGFSAFSPELPSEDRWVTEPGVLRGAAGIALALLAAATDAEPAWDRMLLVATPQAEYKTLLSATS